MPVTVDDLSALLNSPMPRELPRSLRRARKDLLGLACFGAIFGLFGLPFMLLFFPWRFADELRLDLGGAQQAPGEVVSVRETTLSVNETRVYAIRFAYDAPSRGRIERTCYATGQRHAAGDKVSIEYLPAAPEIARVRGCRLTKTGYFTAFVVLFPLVGFGMMFFSLRARGRFLGLLRNGHFAQASIVDVKETNVTVNDRRRYKITLTYTAGDAPLTTTYNAYGHEVEVARAKMASGETAGLLYDPARPERVALLEALLG